MDAINNAKLLALKQQMERDAAALRELERKQREQEIVAQARHEEQLRKATGAVIDYDAVACRIVRGAELVKVSNNVTYTTLSQPLDVTGTFKQGYVYLDHNSRVPDLKVRVRDVSNLRHAIAKQGAQ